MNVFENIIIEAVNTSINSGTNLEQDQLKDYFNDSFFSDLKNEKITIKKKGTLYIFEQNEDLSKTFSIEENLLKQYLENEAKKEQTITESDTILKNFLNEIYTKNELKKAQNEVITKNLNDLGSTVNKNLDKTSNSETLLTKIEELLIDFKDHKKRPKSNKPLNNKDIKKRYKDIIKDDISLLKSIKKDLSKYTFETNLDYYENIVEQIEDHKEKLEEVRQIIVTGGSTSDIPAILESIKSVKKEEKFQNKTEKYNEKYNKLMKNATLKKLRNKDAEGFQEYLKGVWSGEIEHAAENPFYVRYKEDFEYIASVNPQLYKEITTSQKKKDKNNNNQNNYSNDYYFEYNNKNIKCTKKGGVFDGFKETFADIIYRGEDPKKREAREQAGKLGAIIGGVVLGFQFLKNLFAKKGTEGKRKNVALYGGGLLALLNFDKLSDWVKTVRGKDKEIEEAFGVDNSPIYQDYMSPVINTMEVIGGIPIQTLIQQKIIITKDKKLQLDYDKYVETINNDISLSDIEKQNLIKKAKKIKEGENILSNGLGLLGINSINDLESLSGEDDSKTLLDTNKMDDHFENIVSPVNSLLAKEGFKPKDAQSWHAISKEYDSSSFNNDIIINWMEKGLIIPKYKTKYDLDKMLKHPSLDLTNKTLNGFVDINGNKIKFDNYDEMFSAMQLTDFIIENFKGQKANSSEPFHETALGNIEFDNTKWYELWKNETKVINSNLYKSTLDSISPTLYKYKDSYVRYLNKWRESEGKIS